jgi:hypothetical protein
VSGTDIWRHSSTAESEMSDRDEAARLARIELDKNWDHWTARDVAVWWKRWSACAGNDRLARALVETADDPPLDRHVRSVRP